MNVAQLIVFLQQFPDQEAVVQIIKHNNNDGGYYCQGGTVEIVDFEPKLFKGYEYTDFRGNPWIKENCPHYNLRTLLLGETN